jgi:hypothetical protein
MTIDIERLRGSLPFNEVCVSLIFYIIMCCAVQGYPSEKVGVFVQRGKGGPLSVVEYIKWMQL